MTKLNIRDLTRHWSKRNRAMKLTQPQWQHLALISKDRSTISLNNAVVTRLEEKGLIRATERSGIYINAAELTDAGRAKIREGETR